MWRPHGLAGLPPPLPPRTELTTGWASPQGLSSPHPSQALSQAQTQPAWPLCPEVLFYLPDLSQTLAPKLILILATILHGR